ncbi:MAG: hypothetical protein RLZZ450_151 [Pseudomonadota bacterium]|jgi:hypothetical protein
MDRAAVLVGTGVTTRREHNLVHGCLFELDPVNGRLFELGLVDSCFIARSPPDDATVRVSGAPAGTGDTIERWADGGARCG